MKKYNFTVKALSPITHTEETNSNITSVYRQKIIKNNIIHEIPCVHGNAIRGVLRRIGSKYICDKVGIKPNSVKIEKYFMLFNGGFLEKSKSFADIKDKRELRDLMPFLSVFGSAIGNEMLQGKLIVSFAVPKCKELETGKISYNDMTQIIRYTRKDDTEQNTEKTSQMFYDTEVISEGVEFEIEFILDSDNELEISAFEKTLELFSEKPYIGGNSRIGHGKLDFDFSGNSKIYDEFLKNNKEKVCNWLTN